MSDPAKIKKLDYIAPGTKQRKAAKPRGQNRNRYRIMATECHYCHDILFSRARHDFRWCSCGKTYVDGGSDYLRIGWTDRRPRTYKLFIHQSPSVLYDDWNSKTDRYGRISRENARKEGILNKTYKRDDEWSKDE